jgi:hypothetical protein
MVPAGTRAVANWMIGEVVSEMFYHASARPGHPHLSALNSNDGLRRYHLIACTVIAAAVKRLTP